MLKYVFHILLVCVTFNSGAQSFQSVVDNWVKDPSLAHASIGFKAVQVNSNEVLGEYNSNMALVPASNLKLLTTAAALEVLGPDKTFATQLMYTGNIKAGVLKGDLIIRGGGDPSLGSKYYGGSKKVFEAWKVVLDKNGIQSIVGRIIADASAFPDYVIPRTWIWEDIGNYYGCGVSGLTFIDNTFHLIFSSHNQANKPTSVERTEPQIQNLVIDNHVTSSDENRDNAYLFGGPYNFTKRAEGTIPKGRTSFKIKGSLPDPAFQLSSMFNQYINTQGIKVSKGNATIREIRMREEEPLPNPAEYKSLSQYPGMNVKELVYYTNQHSVNLFAEHLNCLMGLEKYQKATSPSGNKVVLEYLKDNKLPVGGVNLVDGSGMSRFNTVTANLMTSLLVKMSKGGQSSNFQRSLAVSGKSGTFKSFLNSPETKGLVQGKSGYMERVRSYSGYIDTSKGKVAFAVIVNNYSCSAGEMKRKIETLLKSLITDQNQ